MVFQRSALHTPSAPNEGIEQLQSTRIEINRATAAEISVLPGIGPALADRIVADRERHGRFASIDDLSRVPGIGPQITRRVAPFISFEAE